MNAPSQIDWEWRSACPLSALTANLGACLLLEGKQIALFYLGETAELYAVDNHDPLGGAPVISRGIVGDIDGDPVVSSPLYKQHFSLTSGKCYEDESVQLSVYPVRLQGEHVQIGLPKT